MVNSSAGVCHDGDELNSYGERLETGSSIGSPGCLDSLYLVFAISVNSPGIFTTRNLSKIKRNCNPQCPI